MSIHRYLEDIKACTYNDSECSDLFSICRGETDVASVVVQVVDAKGRISDRRPEMLTKPGYPYCPPGSLAAERWVFEYRHLKTVLVTHYRIRYSGDLKSGLVWI